MWANQRWTWLIQLELVGVKCMWKRGCLVSESMSASTVARRLKRRRDQAAAAPLLDLPCSRWPGLLRRVLRFRLGMGLTTDASTSHRLASSERPPRSSVQCMEHRF